MIFSQFSHSLRENVRKSTVTHPGGGAFLSCGVDQIRDILVLRA